MSRDCFRKLVLIDAMAMRQLCIDTLQHRTTPTAAPRYKATQGRRYVSTISALFPRAHQSHDTRQRGGHRHAFAPEWLCTTLAPPRRLTSPALLPTSLHHDVLSLCSRIANAAGLI
jgi:hypothetical protein